MADQPQQNPTGGSGDEIQPYRIHVSSKYLDITRQKLELTRLPHEPRSKDWWEPKPQVESLCDFWQEHYSWPDHEKELNSSLPQFRTSFETSTPPTPVRIHFIHARSPHANAVPLLLIPPFPLTNLSLGHLVQPLSDPEDAGSNQPFHLVMPALPGLGFSDPLPGSAPPISTTAQMLDELMKRLGYEHYIASNSGSASASPAGIDWRIAKHLAHDFSESCLGFHFIAPPLSSPKLQDSASEWMRWTLARLLGSPVLGYSKDDISATQKQKASQVGKKKSRSNAGQAGHGNFEPNTPSYALCDSPTGLLLYVLKVLRTLGPKKELTPEDIITLTQLIWLPGPEAALRFWAQSASQIEPVESKKPTRKPKVAITVFTGDEEQSEQQRTLPRPAKTTYACPSWANTEYQVLHLSRASGTPGFLAWDRPDVIVDGARGLAKEILAKDKRMQVSEQPGATLQNQLEAEGGQTAQAELSGTTVQDPNATPAGTSPKPAPKRPIEDENQHLIPPQVSPPGRSSS
ncbi:epoxide hydrolase [Fusarium albosuccineum]|uniref:Epoxide hydrolase n=1 Tax=Fusarium albosuccineum TaxID=1237068 RepID=A0A8H4LJZ9_9HYPO|nr:epoxide hydrolase [Fusarium albosuccineum]